MRICIYILFEQKKKKILFFKFELETFLGKTFSFRFARLVYWIVKPVRTVFKPIFNAVEIKLRCIIEGKKA